MSSSAMGEPPRPNLTPRELELAETLDDAAVAMHWVGVDGTILWANRTELVLLGYGRDEYVGRPITDFHVDRPSIDDILRRLKAGETIEDHPARLRAKDGTILDVLIDSNVLFDEAGQFRHTRCFTRDVSERRRLAVAERVAREQAEQQAARLALLASASRAFSEASFDTPAVCEAVADSFIRQGFADACGVLVVDEDRSKLLPVVVRATNESVERVSRELLAKRPVAMGSGLSGGVAARGEPLLVPTIDVEQMLAQTDPAYHEQVRRHGARSLLLVPLIAEGEVVGVLAAVRSSDDRAFTLDDQTLATDIADRAGLAFAKARAFEIEREACTRLTRLHELIGVLTAATSAEQIAAAAVERGCETANASSGLVYRIDEEGSLRLAAHRGVPETFLRGLSVIPSDSDLPGAVAVRTGEAIWIESWEQYRERFPELSSRAEQNARAPAFAAVPMSSGGRVLGVLAFGYMAPHRFPPVERAFLSLVAHHAGHALARADLFEKTERAARRAEEANRLKDDFLATVSHELRTPLSSILGWASILSGPRGSDPAVVAKGVEVIERNGRAQLRLIEDMLDISRIVLGRITLNHAAVDLAPLVREVVDGLKPTADNKGLHLSFESSSACRVMGDADRLRQVVWNLVSNAIKFTDPGGTVQVTARFDGNRVGISVRDTGCGIEPEFLPHVFDRFRQQDGRACRDHGGLGLGLAIVRHLVEMHDGEVDVFSAGPSRGATFTVWLPECPAVLALESEPGSPPSAPSIHEVSIVVVDDDDDSREAIGAILSAAGADVRQAASVEEALEVIATSCPDVVLTDIAMPGRDGYDLLGRVKEDWPWLPVYALTAFEPDQERSAVDLFDEYLIKPVEPATLTEAVARIRADPPAPDELRPKS